MENKCTFLRNAGTEQWANKVPVPIYSGAFYTNLQKCNFAVLTGKNLFPHRFQIICCQTAQRERTNQEVIR